MYIYIRQIDIQIIIFMLKFYIRDVIKDENS